MICYEANYEMCVVFTDSPAKRDEKAMASFEAIESIIETYRIICGPKIGSQKFV